MGRALVVLRRADDRHRSHQWIDAAPDGTRIEFKGPKRTLPQNDRFWAMLTDIATQHMHFGRKYSPDDWKIIILHAWGREVQFVPSLDGSTFIPFCQSSSDLSVEEMTEVIEFMFAWGAQNGIVFHEPERAPPIGELVRKDAA